MDAPDYRRSGGILPRHAKAVDALARAMPVLAPHRRILPSDAAAKSRYLKVGNSVRRWRNDVTPYMVEPADMTDSRRYRALVFVGPARTGKTDGLIINKAVHTVTCKPQTFHIVHMTEKTARDFSFEKIDPMLAVCPDVRERQLSGPSADTIMEKRFKGGMRLTLGWPVGPQVAGRDIPLTAATDYDAMPDDIGGEGSLYIMLRKRTQTFHSLGMSIFESSPRKPILDENWTRVTPHEAPPTTGILALYNDGTRAFYYWQCPECGEWFAPCFEHFHYPEKASPRVAGDETVLIPPCCSDKGVFIEHGHKNEMNRAGRWLHESAAGVPVPIDDPEVRPTDTLSYWLKGPHAAFATWAEIVQRYLEAKALYKRTGDETTLKAVWNVDIGLPYLAQDLVDTDGLTPEFLKARAKDLPVAVAPEGTRFIVIVVDTQKNRFVVQAEAYGTHMERFLIDRFELHDPPKDAPRAGKRALDPARYIEDWAVLEDLINRQYPVGDTGFALTPVCVTVDSAGAPGVTDKAYKWWRKKKAQGQGLMFRLLKGDPSDTRTKDRAYVHRIEKKPGSTGRKANGTGIPIHWMVSNKLKDGVDAALKRPSDGPGALHLLKGLDPVTFVEMCAERKTGDQWDKKIQSSANEAWILACYSLGIAIILGAEGIEDWENPPDWAAPVPQNLFTVTLANHEQIVSTVPPNESPPADDQDDEGDGWMGDVGDDWMSGT